MKKILDEIYDKTNILYNKYKKSNKPEDLFFAIKNVEKIYKNLTLPELNKLDDIVKEIENAQDMFELDNYEMIMYADREYLVIRRILLDLNRYIINYHDENDEPFYLFSNFGEMCAIKINDDAIYELYNKSIANIELKFLYLLQNNNKLNNFEKNECIKKLMFINPYIEEKILKNPSFEDNIKNEDNLKNNLWTNIEIEYDNNFITYILNEIEKNYIYLSTGLDIKSQLNFEIRSTYLRTLFSYVDITTIHQINENFKNSRYKATNKIGENRIKEIIGTSEEDKKLIKKIKNT